MWGTEAGWLLLAAATAGVAHGTTTSPPGTSALAPPDDFIDIVWAPDAVWVDQDEIGLAVAFETALADPAVKVSFKSDNATSVLFDSYTYRLGGHMGVARINFPLLGRLAPLSTTPSKLLVYLVPIASPRYKNRTATDTTGSILVTHRASEAQDLSAGPAGNVTATITTVIAPLSTTSTGTTIPTTTSGDSGTAGGTASGGGGSIGGIVAVGAICLAASVALVICLICARRRRPAELKDPEVAISPILGREETEQTSRSPSPLSSLAESTLTRVTTLDQPELAHRRGSNLRHVVAAEPTTPASATLRRDEDTDLSAAHRTLSEPLPIGEAFLSPECMSPKESSFSAPRRSTQWHPAAEEEEDEEAANHEGEGAYADPQDACTPQRAGFSQATPTRLPGSRPPGAIGAVNAHYDDGVRTPRSNHPTPKGVAAMLSMWEGASHEAPQPPRDNRHGSDTYKATCVEISLNGPSTSAIGGGAVPGAANSGPGILRARELKLSEENERLKAELIAMQRETVRSGGSQSQTPSKTAPLPPPPRQAKPTHNDPTVDPSTDLKLHPRLSEASAYSSPANIMHEGEAQDQIYATLH